MPRFQFGTIQTDGGRLRDILVDVGKLSSQKEAKRIIRQGGVYVDEKRIDDIDYRIDFDSKDKYRVRIGPRRVWFLEKNDRD